MNCDAAGYSSIPYLVPYLSYVQLDDRIFDTGVQRLEELSEFLTDRGVAYSIVFHCEIFLEAA